MKKDKAQDQGQAVKETQTNKWNKAQLLKAQRYVHQRDLVSAVLDDGKAYTVEQVDRLIRKYMEGGAK